MAHWKYFITFSQNVLVVTAPQTPGCEM
uniref:Uncharacterized protein n=1 Tax=Rhizophora mucronata TaxID=61149 RepID=A0A2P2N9B3_RHIMU